MELNDTIDAAMEALVVPSFTSVGSAVRSRLDDWQPLDHYDLSDRVVLLTGATSGLGRRRRPPGRARRRRSPCRTATPSSPDPPEPGPSARAVGQRPSTSRPRRHRRSRPGHHHGDGVLAATTGSTPSSTMPVRCPPSAPKPPPGSRSPWPARWSDRSCSPPTPRTAGPTRRGSRRHHVVRRHVHRDAESTTSRWARRTIAGPSSTPAQAGPGHAQRAVGGSPRRARAVPRPPSGLGRHTGGRRVVADILAGRRAASAHPRPRRGHDGGG